MRRQKGFSLVELLIVVAIILIICAIAIPNFLRARMSANESSAVASLRSIVTAEAAYNTLGWSNPDPIGFSAQLSDLGDSAGCNPPTATSVCQLDDSVANATSAATPKSGYYFVYTPITSGTYNGGYTVNAEPVSRGATGQRSFYTDATGVIRFNATQAATSTDSAIQ